MTDSHLSFNKDVTPDSSSLDLRQHGDVWRSNVWVLHSSRPCALPSQHSQDSRQCCASWSEGVRTRPAALRLTVQQWQNEKSPFHTDDSPAGPQKRRKMDKGTIQSLLTQKADAGFTSANKSLESIRMIMWKPDGAETDGANSSFYCAVSGRKLGESCAGSL